MASPAKALLVGATGQIGGQIRQLLPPGQTLPTGRSGAPGELPLDLAELATLADAERALAGHNLSAIYCIAGMTTVDLCEDQPARAQAINGTGPRLLAQVAAQRGIPYCFFSTEYVFDGIAGPYTEESKPNPLNVYGRTKLDGEHAVLAAHPRALVLRTTVVYGPDRNKANNYLYSVARNLSHNTSMKVPQDQVSTPSYNRDVAAATVALMQRGATGVYHLTGPQLLGRLDFARSIATAWHLDATLLQGVNTSDLHQKAPRPLSAGLLTNKLRREHPDLGMRPLAEALADCRDEVLAAVRG